MDRATLEIARRSTRSVIVGGLTIGGSAPIVVQGMAKVPKGERLRFFAREIEKPLFWLDDNWARVRELFPGGE